MAIGLPGPDDAVGVWGQSPTAPRGETVSGKTDAPLIRVEDAFLRSLHLGRDGEPPLGLSIDTTGLHFDPGRPSDLETLLATHPLDDTGLLTRARDAIAFMARHHLSKYAATDPDLPVPDPGYVVVIDQTLSDASVTASGATVATFRDMLVQARINHPGARILIKTHPETDAGHRKGHFDDLDLTDGVTFLSGPVSPWRLFEGATAVYTVSSGLGFEAIFAGHKPRVFGGPFYAGWGLTEDHHDLPRRTRPLTRAQLFAAAMILYPRWYDPYRDALCELETVLHLLVAQARAWREDRMGWSAGAISRWKRPHLQAFFGSVKPVIFSDIPASNRRHMVWASKSNPDAPGLRLEDGFLRSRGLGAALTPPLSLSLDDTGIHYDPSRESRLESLIAASTGLGNAEIERASRLIHRITALGLTKYNISGRPAPDLPDGPKILVAGQVDDDASVLQGTSKIRTNADLLAAARAKNPDATLIYKPHPDVEAGHRKGAINLPGGVIPAPKTDPAQLLPNVTEVWTMTSLLGFEALLRGIPVTTTGAPFYAGWGLTTDRGDPPARRTARPTLEQLAHATLIDYPRYRDPVTGLACPPEVIIDRLASDDTPRPKGLLARLQSLRPRRR